LAFFYGWLLAVILRRRILTPAVAALVVIGGSVLFVFVGTDFFPGVDAGLIQFHVRGPARTRIERTEQMFQAIEDNMRTQIPAGSYT
jgi:multidrug efflux pump subunit AcrB